jgi:hypothetical protein
MSEPTGGRVTSVDWQGLERVSRKVMFTEVTDPGPSKVESAGRRKGSAALGRSWAEAY